MGTSKYVFMYTNTEEVKEWIYN